MIDPDAVTLLSDDECLALLRANELGRIALTAGGEIDIFPINYVLDDADRIVFRTAPGTKLAQLVIRPAIAFEIDGYLGEEVFSVIVKGEASLLETSAEIAAAQQLPLRPWVPTVKQQFVRVAPTSITGLRFTPGPEPELDPASTPA